MGSRSGAGRGDASRGTTRATDDRECLRSERRTGSRARHGFARRIAPGPHASPRAPGCAASAACPRTHRSASSPETPRRPACARVGMICRLLYLQGSFVGNLTWRSTVFKPRRHTKFQIMGIATCMTCGESKKIGKEKTVVSSAQAVGRNGGEKNESNNMCNTRTVLLRFTAQHQSVERFRASSASERGTRVTFGRSADSRARL